MELVINHILIHTKDVNGMVKFFENILKLKKGYRPNFPFAGAWLWTNGKPLIHLSEANSTDKGFDAYLDNREISSRSGTGIIDHIAFSGDDYKALIHRIKKYKLNYFERSIPESGEQQVFVDGPEGLRIEIQFRSIK